MRLDLGRSAAAAANNASTTSRVDDAAVRNDARSIDACDIGEGVSMSLSAVTPVSVSRNTLSAALQWRWRNLLY